MEQSTTSKPQKQPYKFKRKPKHGKKKPNNEKTVPLKSKRHLYKAKVPDLTFTKEEIDASKSHKAIKTKNEVKLRPKKSLYKAKVPDLTFTKEEIDASMSHKAIKTKKEVKLRPKKTKKFWWKTLIGEDPLSLQRLSDLNYPPFELKTINSKKGSYFDGIVLAEYFVKRSNFINPLNRDPITRDICLSLDQYLKEHKLKQVNVTKTFDIYQKLMKEKAKNNQSTPREIEYRREQATVLHSLFHFDYNRDRNRDNQERFDFADDTNNYQREVIDDLPSTVEEAFPSLTQNARISSTSSSNWDQTVASSIRQSLRTGNTGSFFQDTPRNTRNSRLQPLFHTFKGLYSPFSVDFYAKCEQVGWSVVLAYETRILTIFKTKRQVEIEVKSDKKALIIERLCNYYNLTLSTLYRRALKFLTITNTLQATEPEITLDQVKNGVFKTFYSTKLKQMKESREQQRLDTEPKYNVLLLNCVAHSSLTIQQMPDLKRIDMDNIHLFFNYGVGIKNIDYKIERVNGEILALQFQTKKDARNFFNKAKEMKYFKILLEELKHKGVINKYYDKLQPKYIQFWPQPLSFLREQVDFIGK